MEVAAILLQKLIRGRISQNLMYQGNHFLPGDFVLV